jgi:hypothetical protein
VVMGRSVWAVLETTKKLEEESQMGDKSPYCRGATGHVIRIKDGEGVDPGNVTTCAKFGLHRFDGFVSSGGRSSMFAIRRRYGTNNIALHALAAHACDWPLNK